MDNRPIGVFDSGLGGLTGVRERMVAAVPMTPMRRFRVTKAASRAAASTTPR